MTAVLEHPLDAGVPPSWASEWGQDRFGVFAGIRVGRSEYRFRWVPGGEFVMGSPGTEVGRSEDEVQHEVALGGFWLGELPVTQALWNQVTGGNPSQFHSGDRPVECVSWNDCSEFLERLNGASPGLDARLPTEAEWEFACRAGTETATYAGDLEVLGERNAPVLDQIAWYGGNSGVDFDLDDGHDSSSWPEKQYDHVKAGSRVVGRKRPNGLGLYDTLGNVWEWCWDWYGSYPTDRVVNPPGPSSGDSRVLRGGSWNDFARHVRAACRHDVHPDDRFSGVGFRLARGPEGSGARD